MSVFFSRPVCFRWHCDVISVAINLGENTVWHVRRIARKAGKFEQLLCTLAVSNTMEATIFDLIRLTTHSFFSSAVGEREREKVCVGDGKRTFGSSSSFTRRAYNGEIVRFSNFNEQ